jgi:hypothetical protein
MQLNGMSGGFVLHILCQDTCPADMPSGYCRLLAKAIESASCESRSAEGEYVTNLSLNLLPYLHTIARNARSIRKCVKELRRLGG